MRDGLATLENSDNRRLTFEIAVFGHADMRFFVLFFRLLELDLVDLDAILGMLKGGVDGEGVGFVDVFAFRVLC